MKQNENERYCDYRFKLRIYNHNGLDHEEYFASRDEMERAYSCQKAFEGYALNATKWKCINDEWVFVPIPVTE